MNKYKMFLVMLTSALLRRRLRMFIALLAVAIGATIISGMVTVYKEVPEQMGRAFRAYGANLLILPSNGEASFTTTKISEIYEQLKDYEVIGITPFLYDSLIVNRQTVTSGGADFEALRLVSPYWQIKGEWPQKNKKEVLIGAEFAERIRVSPGDIVTVSGGEGSITSDYRVAGIVRTGGSEENFIFLNIHDLQKIRNRIDEISLAQISIVAQQDELVNVQSKILNSVVGVEAQIVKQIANSENKVLGKLHTLVLIVTIVVLILTLICVSTTMMAIVTERRKEIGLKKALGADNKHIIIEFFGEGCLLGALGGGLGAFCGYIFAEHVSLSVFAREIDFSPDIAVITLILSILLTGTACLVPVKIATQVDPALILRGE